MNLKIANLRIFIAGQQTPVLDIAALYLAQGETLAVSGASGSGKTTLINHLCGLARTKPGAVLWNDTDIHALSPGACDRWRGKHIGLIMQDFHLINGLCALDNVLLPQAIADFPKTVAPVLTERAVSLLSDLGITDASRRVETYSRGEMQRIAIARALLNTPEIIIADEPTASLDAANAANIGALLRDIAARQQATLICVTHDSELKNSLSQQLVLEHGHIISTTLSDMPPA